MQNTPNAEFLGLSMSYFCYLLWGGQQGACGIWLVSSHQHDSPSAWCHGDSDTLPFSTSVMAFCMSVLVQILLMCFVISIGLESWLVLWQSTNQSHGWIHHYGESNSSTGIYTDIQYFPSLWRSMVPCITGLICEHLAKLSVQVHDKCRLRFFQYKGAAISLVKVRETGLSMCHHFDRSPKAFFVAYP